MTPAQLHNYHLRAQPPGVATREKDEEERAFAAGVDDRFDPGRSPALTDVMGTAGLRVVTVQTDAPRKGMPILFTGWLAFRKTPEGRDARLIVKLSSLDVTADMYRVHFHASLALGRAARRLGVEEPNVWFVYDRLDDARLAALMAGADVYYTATYGEGFGGPVAEALMFGVPVVSPDHTSLRDLVGENYPLAVESEPHVLCLWNNIAVYSHSSTWRLPKDASIVEKLSASARMSPAERRAVALAAREALLARASPAAVSAMLGPELDAAQAAAAGARPVRAKGNADAIARRS